MVSANARSLVGCGGLGVLRSGDGGFGVAGSGGGVVGLLKIGARGVTLGLGIPVALDFFGKSSFSCGNSRPRGVMEVSLIAMGIAFIWNIAARLPGCMRSLSRIHGVGAGFGQFC